MQGQKSMDEESSEDDEHCGEEASSEDEEETHIDGIDDGEVGGVEEGGGEKEVERDGNDLGIQRRRWDRSSLAQSIPNGTMSNDDLAPACSVFIKRFGLTMSSKGSSTDSSGRSETDCGPCVQVNQVVVCVPTLVSREEDKKAGYNLPFSLGRVLEVKGSGVVVAWLFALFADGVWRAWDTGKKGSRRIRRDELEWADLLRDSAGVVVVSFCANKTLKQVSLARLKGNIALKMSDDEWRSYFKRNNK